MPPIVPSPKLQPEPISHGTFEAWCLNGPLTIVLGLIAVLQLLLWVPHYLTWPYWADHDAYATLARSWDLGVLPYRDARMNNFPGSIYLFYLLGKTVGWGRPIGIYGIDACLVMALGLMILIWSRGLFKSFLPGLIGYVVFLSYYLSLDYAHAAQRDWHAPCLCALGLLITQRWPGRTSRIVSATLAAMALSIRPQSVLLIPAILLAISEGGRRHPFTWERLTRVVSEWILWFTLFAVLMFLPLLASGIFGDFLRSLKLVAYGSSYNKSGPLSIIKNWCLQVVEFRWIVVAGGILILIRRVDSLRQRTAATWLVAMAGVSLYKPASPLQHSYLDHPLNLIWAINVAVLGDLLLNSKEVTSWVRLVAVVGLLGLGPTTIKPEFDVVWASVNVVESIRQLPEPVVHPPGYVRGTVETSGFYPWEDYRNTLIYLRSQTKPTTRIANALKGDPAICASADRLSAFPAESLSWLRMVRTDEEAAYLASLEKHRDSVVVWAPSEAGFRPQFKVDQLFEAIQRLYELEARFGVIEVWRRRPEL